MTSTTRWQVALAVGGTTVIELMAGPPGWAMVLDGAVAVALFSFAAVALDVSRRYALICACTGVAWLLPEIVPGTSWLHRALMVAAVLSFSDGRLRRPYGAVVVLGVAAAGLVPAPTPRAVALASLGVAIVLVAVSEGPPGGGPWPKARRAPQVRAAVLTGVALWMPLVSLVLQDTTVMSGTITVERVVELAYALMLLAATVVLLWAVVSLEGQETESVLALSETEGTDATLGHLRVAAASANDVPTRRALDSAIALLEHNVALHQQLTGAVEEARDSRRRLAAALERERRMLRARLAERAMPELAVLARSVGQLDDDALDAAGRALVLQCRAEVASIGDDLEVLAEGLHPAALSQAGLSGFAEVAAHSTTPVVVHLPETRLPPDIEAALWFSCSEALANAVKHANPTCVTVSGTVREGRVVVEIHDDGVGGAHFLADGGLASLEDRLRAVDGTLTLASPRSGGTTVRMEVPLP
ncbi:MAG: integral rane sensor signal transduction histidine kinase [Ornithinibacter sp.]|nr:integral rane sensor signal transduction histidine kinase [Ornithinibacter sp.]